MRKNLLKAAHGFFVLFFFLFLQQAHAQKTREIRGTITDSAGAVVGVSVTVKNKTNIGTTTDLNGKFFLNVPENAVLVISMVGYDSHELSIQGKEVSKFELKH